MPAIKIQELLVEVAEAGQDTVNLQALGVAAPVFAHLLRVLADKDIRVDTEYIGPEHRLDHTTAVVVAAVPGNLDTIALVFLTGKVMMARVIGHHRMKVILTVLDLVVTVLPAV
jgi:hypothetical protein